MLNLRDARRLWSKVRVGDLDDCWEWQAYRTSKGYGRFALNGEPQDVHRVVYREFYGDGLDEIDPTSPNQRMTVMHDCDNPSCCNPAHLRLGTNAKNARDRVEKGRQARGHHVNVGSAHGNHILNESTVQYIKDECAKGVWGTQTRLARELGVSPQQISRIANGIQWRHIQ